MILEPSVVIGGMILCLLCFADYRQKVTRIGNKTAYHFFLVIFVALNLAVYWFLCQFFADPLFKAVSANTLGISAGAADLLPIILAFGYFGVGAHTIRLGKIEVSLYGKMLEMVQSLLPAKVSVWTDVRKAIREGDLQRHKMLEDLKDLRSIASQRKWDNLDKQWRNAKLQCNYLDRRCAMLEKHLEALNSAKLDREKIEWLKSDTLQHLQESQTKVLNLYKDYLADFICVNLRDEGEIRRILSQLGITRQEPEAPKPICVHYRCLVAGFLAGLTFGPISYLGGQTQSSIPILALQGAVSVAVMSWIFSALHGRLDSFLSVLVIGIVGGYVGYSLFALMQPGKLQDIEWLKKLPMFSLTGSMYGVMISMLLAAYNRWVVPRIRNMATGIAVLGVSGALAMWGTFLVCQHEGIKVSKDTNDLATLGVGFVLAVFLGYGLDLFAEGKMLQRAEPQPESAE